MNSSKGLVVKLWLAKMRFLALIFLLHAFSEFTLAEQNDAGVPKGGLQGRWCIASD